MNPDPKPLPRLIDLEREVVAQAHEWGRQRLQQLADQSNEVFPLRQRKRRRLSLQSELGKIELVVDYGQDGLTGQWLCPLQRH